MRHSRNRRGLVKVWLVICCMACALGRVTCVPPQEVGLDPARQPAGQPSLSRKSEPGPDAARFDTLFAYFQAANPALFSHLESLQKRRAKGETHWGLSYVAGTSGVGKSYVVRNVAMFDKAAAVTIKLSSLFRETLPDLQTLDGKIVFNRLPGAVAPDVQSVLDAIDPAKTFILIDDLDEVHEQTARAVLKALEIYVAQPRSGFGHVVVFGRPESFRPWLHDPERTVLPQVTQTPLILHGPEYRTSGDIEFRCQDYYGFKFDKEAPQAVIDDVVSQLDRFPFLRETMRPLAAGNLVLDD
ncbi:MAG: AAA family ATPase, partial [Planctomycetes bacterium]|nr:AAA family ATPase [Planctomycetota bacterium]